MTELTIEVEGAESFAWRAGQYLALATLDDPDDRHHYSIASVPEARRPGVFELAIANSSGAEVLGAATVGAGLRVDGPFGELGWHPAPGALLVGAGTGMVPLRALVRAALGAAFAGSLRLVVGSRSAEDLLFREELEALERVTPGFRYAPVLSQPDGAWTGRRGHVQDHLNEVGSGLPAGSRAYLCGSTQMVAECHRLLEELGVQSDRVLSEAYR